MNKTEWEKFMPEVPECVHSAVLDALEHLEESGETEMKPREGKHLRRKKFTKGKVIALAAAMTAVLGMTAIVAAEELWWNQKVSEAFQNPEPGLQEQMSEQKVAQEQEASVTENGITLTAVQTVRDSNRIYMLFEIAAEEEIVDGNSGFDDWKMITGEGEDLLGDYFHSGGGGMLPETAIGELGTAGYYYYDILLDDGSEWNGESLAVSFTDFTYYTYENGISGGNETPHRIEGTWELKLLLTDVSEMQRTYEPNREITVSGVPVTVRSVTLTPLTLTIHYDSGSVIKLLEEVYGGEEDSFLRELYVSRLVDASGNTLEQGYGAAGGVRTQEEEILTAALTTVVDVDSVSAILLGDEEVQVELKE